VMDVLYIVRSPGGLMGSTHRVFWDGEDIGHLYLDDHGLELVEAEGEIFRVLRELDTVEEAIIRSKGDRI